MNLKELEAQLTALRDAGAPDSTTIHVVLDDHEFEEDFEDQETLDILAIQPGYRLGATINIRATHIEA